MQTQGLTQVGEMDRETISTFNQNSTDLATTTVAFNVDGQIELVEEPKGDFVEGDESADPVYWVYKRVPTGTLLSVQGMSHTHWKQIRHFLNEKQFSTGAKALVKSWKGELERWNVMHTKLLLDQAQETESINEDLLAKVTRLNDQVDEMSKKAEEVSAEKDKAEDATNRDTVSNLAIIAEAVTKGNGPKAGTVKVQQAIRLMYSQRLLSMILKPIIKFVNATTRNS